jgi:isopentenyl diphosphate isomerase/L-lactate dehydrogenase-like FMN-dependent dehydrogenase
MAWLGDCKNQNYLEDQVATIKNVNGVGIPTVKPWANRDEYWRKLEVARSSGAMAIATDVDAIGLGYQYSGKVGDKNVGVCSRSVAELKEMAQKAGVPFIIKGIMSPRAAVKAVEAGAYGILISNHGGNIIENSLAPCDVIEDIRKAVGDSIKVFADGGVRSGEDAFKMLALGADAVGIGRPFVVSIYGGGWHGAYIYMQKIFWELLNIMRLTDCKTLKDITRDKVIFKSR